MPYRYAGSPPPFHWFESNLDLSDSSDAEAPWPPLTSLSEGEESSTTPPPTGERVSLQMLIDLMVSAAAGAGAAGTGDAARPPHQTPEENEMSRNPTSTNHTPTSQSMPAQASAGSKRRSRETEDEDEEEASLQCVICTKLVEDAVQSPCCGTLHCRACLTRWLQTPSSSSKCAVCRQLIVKGLITDVRAERESAAAVRRCSYAAHGCTMKGNRKEMREHESSCDFVPLTSLRTRIEALERREQAWQSAVRRRNVQIDQLRQHNQSKQLKIQHLSGSNDTLSKSADQSAQRARDFLVCCLKHEPAAEAMKALHGVAVALKTYREDIQGRPRRAFSFFLTDVLLFESNYNVSAVFVRTAGIVRCPAQDLTVTLLHPLDPKFNVIVRVNRDRWLSLRCGGSFTVSNIMCSEQLSDYCVDGKFYMSHSILLDEDSFACHCGYKYRSPPPACVSRTCNKRW